MQSNNQSVTMKLKLEDLLSGKQHSANDNSDSLCIISIFIIKAAFIIKDWTNFESSAEVSKKGFEHAQETACFSSAE